MDRKILNFSLSIIVILIVVIFNVLYYFVQQHVATPSVYDDIEQVSNTQNFQYVEPEILNTKSTQIQKIYPFTGAFPSIDIIAFMQDDVGKVENLTNEQILRLAWAKVTKEDWADTYISEDNPVSIEAEILDKYIKDIFGNIEYEKADFSNTAYKIDSDENLKAHTGSYEVKYDAKSDIYICSHVPGDGIDEARVNFPNITAIKIDNYIRIDVKTVIVEPEETISEDETYYFKYKVYDNYDLETKSYENQLLEYTENDFSTQEERDNLYKDLDLSKLNTISLIYQLNPETNEYNLKEIQK